MEGSDYTCVINGVNFNGTEFDVLTIGGYHLPDHNNFDVRSLRIGNSSFSTFANRFCCTFPNLQFLSILGHPGIKTLNERSFVKCYNLVKILLNANDINVIEPGTFKDQSDVTSLIIFEGSIGSLNDRSLEGLTSLAALTISNSKLISLPSGLLSNLPNLQFLDLHGNPNEIIPAIFFNNNPKLLFLDLSSSNVFD